MPRFNPGTGTFLVTDPEYDVTPTMTSHHEQDDATNANARARRMGGEDAPTREDGIANAGVWYDRSLVGILRSL